MEGRSAFDFGGNRVIRQSEPMTIGKHEWRLTLYRSEHHERPLDRLRMAPDGRRADPPPMPRRRLPPRRLHMDA